MKWLPAIAVCACTGSVGTIDLRLTTAPSSRVLDGVQRLRVTLTDPRTVVEAPRTAAGFAVVLDVAAAATSGSLIVEGLDATGALVACGQSPSFAVTAITAGIVVYMAPPMSIAEAPVVLPLAQSDVVGAALAFGAVLAGGRDPAGVPTTAIAVYNAYNHALDKGLALLAPRAGMAIASSGSNVLLFGGAGPDDQPTGTAWRFDASVSPGGAYLRITEQPDLARTGELLVPIGGARYLITGAPPLVLDLNTGATPLSARSDIAALPPAGAAVTSHNALTAIFAGAQLVRFRGDAFDTLPVAGHSDAAAAALPDGRVVVVGGGAPPSRDAIAIDAVSGAVTQIPDALAVARTRPQLAVTSRHLIVVGGTDADGAAIASAEVLDAATLAPIATLPIAARTGGFAIGLPNDQVLLGGGAPASTRLELFTPGPPDR